MFPNALAAKMAVMNAAARGIAVTLLAVSLGGCDSQVPTPSPTPAATPTVPAGVTASIPTSIPTGPVFTCGLLTQYASDGNLRLLTIEAGGITTQYRLEQPGTAPRDLPTNQFVRLAGRRIPADSGNLQAVNLTDYTAAPVTNC